jgi:hypothetical protein
MIYHMESRNQAYEKFLANQRKQANAARYADFMPIALDPPVRFAPFSIFMQCLARNNLV